MHYFRFLETFETLNKTNSIYSFCDKLVTRERSVLHFNQLFSQTRLPQPLTLSSLIPTVSLFVKVRKSFLLG